MPPGQLLRRARPLSQWYDDTRDYDLTCAPRSLRAAAGARVHAVGRRRPTSTVTGRTTCWPGWSPRRPADVRRDGPWDAVPRGPDRHRLAGHDALETPGDLNGDGRPDVLARERATGYLWLYPGNGRGGWLPRVRVGTGWDIFTAIVGPGDLTGDQRPDVLARERSTGYLWLYPGNGRGGWLPRVRGRHRLEHVNAIVAPGTSTATASRTSSPASPRTVTCGSTRQRPRRLAAPRPGRRRLERHDRPRAPAT